MAHRLCDMPDWLLEALPDMPQYAREHADWKTCQNVEYLFLTNRHEEARVIAMKLVQKGGISMRTKAFCCGVLALGDSGVVHWAVDHVHAAQVVYNAGDLRPENAVQRAQDRMNLENARKMLEGMTCGGEYTPVSPGGWLHSEIELRANPNGQYRVGVSSLQEAESTQRCGTTLWHGTAAGFSVSQRSSGSES